MYEVTFNQIVKDLEHESYPQQVVVADVDRALAVASMLQKVATPEVKYEAISVQPLKS